MTNEATPTTRNGLHFEPRIGDVVFTTEELSKLAIAIGLEKKAFKPVLIDLKPVGAFTEYFAVLSASNVRHVRAVAEEIRITFKNKFNIYPVSSDGFETNTWILLDYGAFFVHVFQETTRDLYKLESLWSKGRFIEINEEETTKLFQHVKVEQ